jgi:hypothetical protein
MYFIDPLHLQGEINGLSLINVLDKHILHNF